MTGGTKRLGRPFGHADQPIDEPKPRRMVATLVEIAENIRQVLRSQDGGDARLPRDAREIVSLPADAGVDMQDIDAARPKPRSEVIGNRPDREALPHGLLEKAGARIGGEDHIDPRPEFGGEEQHMRADAGGLQAVRGEADAQTRCAARRRLV